MKTPQTPVPKLQELLQITNEVWFKREDKHHYGSHKGRSLPLMIAAHIKNGVTNFVVSSSGNAALAAVRSIVTHNKSRDQNLLSLQIFVSPNIDTAKKSLLEKEKLTDSHINIEEKKSPKQSAIQFAAETGAAYLRQSTDDTALLGYQELAKELAKIPNLAAVFVPTSSGTTALGLHLGFKELGLNPQIHIVQTETCHPIADQISDISRPTNNLPSLASAIVDNIALRKEAVAQAVKSSHGNAWIGNNNDILQAMELSKKSDIIISPNSALSVVGLTKAVEQKTTIKGAVVCLITGP